MLALLLAPFLFLGLCPGPAVRDKELKHDDGKQDSKRSVAGGGHAVAFERPGDPFVVTKVLLHGEQYGGRFDPFLAVARVSLLDADWELLGQTFVPYSEWTPGRADWVEVEMAPCRVPERFYALVEYFPTQTKGIYQSIDESASGSSHAGTLTGLGGALDDGGWMIRVRGTTSVPKIESPDSGDSVVLGHAEGESTGKLSAAGSGHAVRFKAGKHPFLTQVTLCGARYGNVRNPGSRFFHVFVCDKKLDVLARSAHPFSLFASGDLTWVDIPVPPVKVPRDFYVLVCFDPTQSEGVYVGKWKEKGGHSLLAYPGKRGEKVGKGEGWMIRATLAASTGKQELADPADSAEDPGLDAVEVAEIAAAVERAEAKEDVLEANDLIAKLAATNPEDAAELGLFEESPHFLLRRVGVSDAQAAALLQLMEEAHRVLQEEFGFETVAGVADKKIHLHVTLAAGSDTVLFTSPRSPDYSLIVLRGDARALTAPTRGGPHVVYGFLHELGHVLIGWEDSDHQWAHYLGSVLVDRVYESLGEETWYDPYDVPAIEGMARFLKEVENTAPGRDGKAALGRLFYEIGEQFGHGRFGPAVAWIKQHREGKPFGVVRLYLIDDLRDALVEITGDKDTVLDLFGG